MGKAIWQGKSEIDELQKIFKVGTLKPFLALYILHRPLVILHEAIGYPS